MPLKPPIPTDRGATLGERGKADVVAFETTQGEQQRNADPRQLLEIVELGARTVKRKARPSFERACPHQQESQSET